MVEPTTPQTTPQTPTNSLSFLDEVRKEKAELEKVRDETKRYVEELKDLRANEIMSGSTNAGQVQALPQEDTPRQYAEKVLRGEFNKK